jgi:hypothetical protein
LVGTANRTFESDQQLSWAHEYERRMRRFNLMVVSGPFVITTLVSIIWWLFSQIGCIPIAVQFEIDTDFFAST